MPRCLPPHPRRRPPRPGTLQDGRRLSYIPVTLPSQVLCKMVDGYGKHLDVRKDLAEQDGALQGHSGRIVPTFTDLMM